MEAPVGVRGFERPLQRFGQGREATPEVWKGSGVSSGLKGPPEV